MTVDWANFTPWASLAGGALIGAAAAMLILLSGRIAGISGILGRALVPRRGDFAWRIAFIAGLLLAPFFLESRSEIDASLPVLLMAGALVGVGTSYASGCTSGHGVCGLSRLSPRSLVATLAFMGAGFITVFLARHL
jgi:uncharacterized membrane protein YedE/YeeE